VAIGTVFAWLLGLGALFLTVYTSGRSSTNGTVGVSVLFGSILGLQTTQTLVASGAGVATGLAVLAIGRPLLFCSLDPDVATARGVPTRLVTGIFLVLVGVTVAESVQAVGALMIFGLMVTPPAVAQKLTARPYAAIALAAGLAIAFVWLGLTLAFYTPYPASFFITALAFATFLLVVLLERLRRAAERLLRAPGA
jgi:zinc/manganese transport system permease protein